MKIPAQLATGLKWLAEREAWGEVEKAEVRRCLLGDPAFFIHFFTVYIEAVKKGYRYKTGDGYERLAAFCKRVGLDDPYNHLHTDEEVYA